MNMTWLMVYQLYENMERHKVRRRRYLDEYCGGKIEPSEETRQWLYEMFGDDWEVWDQEKEEFLYQSQSRDQMKQLAKELNG